ncbi:MAG: hypothetical protein U5N85_01345 [Arcicella sp.]|nr:hypothetical protein [Arcicella sp.]
MKNIIVIFFFMLISFQISAQEFKDSYSTFDLALAGSSNAFSPAVSYTQMFGVGKSKRFKIGYGIRLTSFFMSNVSARTAPAKFTSGTSSFAALFAEDIITNIDTLQLSSAQNNSLNVSINLQYALAKKLEFGINIDATGYSFGASQTGTLISNKNKRKFTDGTNVSVANPNGLNLLLVSDSDLGSLNSEIYARYWATEKIGIRAGLSFLFTEYASDKKVQLTDGLNNRWRYKSLLPLVAVSYRF